MAKVTISSSNRLHIEIQELRKGKWVSKGVEPLSGSKEVEFSSRSRFFLMDATVEPIEDDPPKRGSKKKDTEE